MKYFFMAALAILMTACSSDDNELTQQPVKAEGITITAQLAPKSSNAKTRAVTESEDKIVVDWAVDEHLAILYEVNSTKYAADARVTAVDGSGNATIEFTVESGTTDGTACQIIYPLTAAKDDHSGVKNNATLLANQDGTLSANLDVRVGAGTIQTSTPSLHVTTQPAAKFAIWKLTLGSAAKNLCILADNETIAGATLASAGTVFTVAVPAVSSKTVTVVANDESNNCYYYSKAGVSLTAGNYYKSTPSMTALGTDSSVDVYKITGTSGGSIPEGRTVVLSGVSISGGNITCNGNATIILMGSNTIAGSYANAAIQAGGTSNTLTITGTGSLTANGGNYAAGIGGGQNTDCGRINISGGNITATGSVGAGIGSGQGHSCAGITISGGTVVATSSERGPGIGSGSDGSCGDITISGGTITATGASGAAGIGTGIAYDAASCGDITITADVTSVTAVKGAYAPNSIGAGGGMGTIICGTITIGGDATTYAAGVTTSPFYYPTAP